MIKKMLSYNYQNVNLIHLPLVFTQNFESLGRLSLRKILQVPILLIRLIRAFSNHNIFAIYYAPAGPNFIANLRDIFILIPCRLLCHRLIIHLHAGGSVALYNSSNSRLFRLLYRLAFFHPYCIIRQTDYSHGEERILEPIHSFIIPNGVDPLTPPSLSLPSKTTSNFPTLNCTISYLGAIYPERGILELLSACSLLHKKDLSFTVKIGGVFTSKAYKDLLFDYMYSNNLENHVYFLGEIDISARAEFYLSTDIFCFPSRVPSETFGLVMVEAMQFGIPIVAPRWNGIPYIVKHNINGLLYDQYNTLHLSQSLEQLIVNPYLRASLGNVGRSDYLNHYTTPCFLSRMDNCFTTISTIEAALS